MAVFHLRSLRGRHLTLLLVTTTLVATLYYLHVTSTAPAPPLPVRHHVVDVVEWAGQQPPVPGCPLPDLPLDVPEISGLFQPSQRLQCDPEPGWVRVSGSRLSVQPEARRRHGEVSCSFSDVLFEADDRAVEKLATASSEGYTLERSDYVKVKCQAADGAGWENILAGVRENAAPRAKTFAEVSKTNQLPLNILIWGFDSLSKNTYMRKLPKTVAFMKDTLGALVLDGYNIVGDGTPQALTPILTGQTELELPEVRRRIQTTNFVNIYPFIWKDLEQDGYVTAFNEDQPDIGTYQYRLRGFNPPPTTHYMRTFFLAAQKLYKKNKPYCLKDIPRHKVMMEHIETMYEVYPDKPKFMFSFHSELSHDDYNKVGMADDDVVEFLERLWRSGRLNNTLMIAMADHGHRFTAVRNTQQGKLEERLPFFAYILPPWFRYVYPQQYNALRHNTRLLTTPFDQFFTLQHVRSWPNPPPPDPHRRGSSLFLPLDPGRTCEQAGIEAHWCACLRWRSLSRQAPKAQAAASAFIDYLWSEVEREVPGRCARLHVEEVLEVTEMEPQPGVMQFVRSSDKDGFVADLSGRGQVTHRLYQLRLRTAPGGGLYEVTLTHELNTDRFVVKHQDVSRTNTYGSQARCVMDRMDHLRKICYCK